MTQPHATSQSDSTGAIVHHVEETNLANGDPVVLIPIIEETAWDPIMLGTGFDSYEDLYDQVAFIVNHDPGYRSTRNITLSNARAIHRTGAHEFEVFVPDARLQIDRPMLDAINGGLSEMISEDQ